LGPLYPYVYICGRRAAISSSELASDALAGGTENMLRKENMPRKTVAKVQETVSWSFAGGKTLEKHPS
jgi:hypothetical protein